MILFFRDMRCLNKLDFILFTSSLLWNFGCIIEILLKALPQVAFNMYNDALLPFIGNVHLQNFSYSSDAIHNSCETHTLQSLSIKQTHFYVLSILVVIRM